MIAIITIIIILLRFASGQINGEFWWLNNKLDKYRETLPPPPKFENLSEFDTDESAKIIFRNNDLVKLSDNFNYKKEYLYESNDKKDPADIKLISDRHKPKSIKFKDESKIVWPTEDDVWPSLFSNLNKSKLETLENHNSTSIDSKINKSHTSEDIFEFKFPESSNIFWNKTVKNNLNKTNKISSNSNKSVKLNCTDKNTNSMKPIKIVTSTQRLPLSVLQIQGQETESICTYLTKLTCEKRGGTVYKKRKFDPHLICCILPLPTEESNSKIFFIDSTKRSRRSNTDDSISAALKQRNALLMRKYGPQVLTAKPTMTTQVTHKIVTQDDDYGIDPYWNIKNSNFKKPDQQNPTLQVTKKKYDYESEDYEADYAVEIPKPGLVGLYSDHAGSAPNWSFMNGHPSSPYGNDGFDYDGSGSSFSYGPTLDPRLEDRLVKITPRPAKQSRPPRQPQTVFSSKEINSYDFETQTITYDAEPDFNVLNGFKLLNFKKRKSKYSRNKTHVVTTDSNNSENSGSKEAVLIASDFESGDNDEDVFDTNQHVMKNCGKAAVDDYRSDRNIGEAKSGSHPWLAIVVLTRKPQTILCYGTLVHARAAVTAADCVHGRNSCPGEVTLVAGVLDLTNGRGDSWQKRLASIYLHENYKPGDLANNLAILHWKRPLRLNSNVQPACLSDPHVGDNCRFYGWSGYDQAIRPRSRWQKATVLTPRQCNERMSARHETIPSDAFCAAVHTRGTVTGIGAPLICLVGGRHTASGVAIWRDHVVLLAPAQQWTMDALSHLNLL